MGPYIWALLNGVIVAALYMRPALESRRLAVAAALFATAAPLSLVSYLGGLVIFLGGSQHVIPLVGLATLAMLLCSALAQRGLKRPLSAGMAKPSAALSGVSAGFPRAYGWP